MHILNVPSNLVHGRPCRSLEDALDQKTAELIDLRKAALEHAVASPIKSIPLQAALGQWGNSSAAAASRSALARSRFLCRTCMLWTS